MKLFAMLMLGTLPFLAAESSESPKPTTTKSTTPKPTTIQSPRRSGRSTTTTPKSETNSCTVTTWGEIKFMTSGKATVNLGTNLLPPAGADSFELVADNAWCKEGDATYMAGPSKEQNSVEACKAVCKEVKDCVAITYFSKRKFCSLFSSFCVNPNRKAKNAKSFRLVAHLGLQIPDIKYNYANCVADNKVAIQAYEYDVDRRSCDMTKPIDKLTFNTNTFAENPYTKTTELTTGIKITGPNLAALQTSDNQPDATNKVEICLKFTIEHNEVELMFSEHLLTVKYSPKLAFKGPTAASVNVERADAKKKRKRAKVLGDLTAFRCDENLVAYGAYDEPVINQHNALVRICVHSKAEVVQCDRFWEATLEHHGLTENRVSKGAIKSDFEGMTAIAGLEDVRPVPNSKITKKGCVLTVMLSSDYFESSTPKKVTITGEVLMSFKSTLRGRRLQDEAPASGEKAASFEIDVPVGETPNANTAARTSFIAAAAGLVMTAAAQCIV